MDKQTASTDIDYIKGIVRRTHARIDTHSFHFVHWGLIVLIWYPLSNWLWQQGYFKAMIGVGIGSVVMGMILSGVRETLLAKNPRLKGENTFAELMKTVRVASLGQITNTLYDVGGKYRRTM